MITAKQAKMKTEDKVSILLKSIDYNIRSAMQRGEFKTYAFSSRDYKPEVIKAVSEKLIENGFTLSQHRSDSRYVIVSWE